MSLAKAKRLAQRGRLVLDPNWFYSSLAQCTAALVGLLGAVLATRLQEQLRHTRLSYRQVEQDLEHLHEALTKLGKHFGEFIAFADRASLEVQDAQRKNETQVLIANFCTFDGSRSGSQNVFVVSPTTIDNFKKQRHLATNTKDIFASIGHVQKISDIKHVRAALQRFKSEIANLFPAAGLALGQRIMPISDVDLVVSALEERAATHSATSSIHLPAFLTTVLAFLSLVGLVVPLAYLSAHPGRSKFLLLLLSALGILAIPGYLCWAVLEVHYLRDVDVTRPQRWLSPNDL